MSIKFSDLKGKTIYHIDADRDSVNIITSDRASYQLSNQEWGGNDVEVYIESIVGDLKDLIGHELLLAEEVEGNSEDLDPKYTWTFYKLATIKGYVDIRFCGTSNGYYSEKAELIGGSKVDEEYFNNLKTKNRLKML